MRWASCLMSNSDRPLSEHDPAWEAMLAQPATRGEVLQIAQLLQLGLLSQSLLGVALIDGDEATQRDIGEATVDRATHVGRVMRSMIDRWTAEQ